MPRLSQPIRRSVWVLLGIVSASFGLKGFLLPGHLIDGGVTGISMLLAKVSAIPLAVLLPLCNFPFVLLGLRQMGKRFALKSTAAILAFAWCLGTIPFPQMTNDPLLTAVFGGFFIGVGIGLAIRSGVVLDGTDLAAVVISRSVYAFRVGEVLLLLNVCIFLVAMWVYGVESALYSILTYLAASRTTDYILHGIEQYTAVVILSLRHKAIRQALVEELNRSVTVYKGAQGISGTPQDILFCVATRLEVGDIKQRVHEIDPSAFVITHAIFDVTGGVVKRPALH